jgi:hypothetical protein
LPTAPARSVLFIAGVLDRLIGEGKAKVEVEEDSAIPS